MDYGFIKLLSASFKLRKLSLLCFKDFITYERCLDMQPWKQMSAHYSNQIKLVFGLAQKDLQVRFLGSYLGLIWAFIQPTVQILIFWFVFQVGFKSVPVDNFPFILWLMSAMIPWLFISDSISSATNSIVENSYLVKKVNFSVKLLPVVKIMSSLFIHVFFIIFLYIMFLLYDFNPDAYSLQVFYYLTCSVLLVLGISWITSSLVIFLKDVGQLVGMILQFVFWLTPIFWSIDILPVQYKGLIKWNPLFYIIEGYRETFIYKRWFWEHSFLTAYFWIFTLFLLVAGIFIFKRLRPHFADVL